MDRTRFRASFVSLHYHITKFGTIAVLCILTCLISCDILGVLSSESKHFSKERNMAEEMAEKMRTVPSTRATPGSYYGIHERRVL